MPEFFAFIKAQLSAFIGGLTDYLVMLLCVELIGWHYIPGIVAGGIIGAVVNFSINKFWSFRFSNQHVLQQLGRFTVVVLGSILLKSAGTFFFTEYIRLDYRLARLLTDGLVSLGFNYILQRYWVFGRVRSRAMS